MDIKDIEKIFNRKRLRDNEETFQEKFSHEADKIIKVKVFQSAVNLDLKNKLEQTETKYVCLENNIAKLQTECESISGKYQEELTLRPEVVNKFTNIQKICDLFERYSERLKETLSRNQADKETLHNAFKTFVLVVKDARSKLEDEKSTNEHQTQMIEILTASKQQADSEIADLKSKLTSAQLERDELFTSIRNRNAEAEMKEQILANLRDEVKIKNEEYNKYLYETQNTIAKQESELKKASEIFESLKQIISNQEQYLKNVCEENNALKDRIAVLQEDHDKQASDMETLRVEMQKLENVEQERQQLEREIESLKRGYEDIENAAKSYKEDVEKEIKKMKSEIESKNDAIRSLMVKSKMDTGAKSRLENLTQKLKKDIEKEKKDRNEKEMELGKRIVELEAIVKHKEDELAKQLNENVNIMKEKKIRKALSQIRAERGTSPFRSQRECDKVGAEFHDFCSERPSSLPIAGSGVKIPKRVSFQIPDKDPNTKNK